MTALLTYGSMTTLNLLSNCAACLTCTGSTSPAPPPRSLGRLMKTLPVNYKPSSTRLGIIRLSLTGSTTKLPESPVGVIRHRKPGGALARRVD